MKMKMKMQKDMKYNCGIFFKCSWGFMKNVFSARPYIRSLTVGKSEKGILELKRKGLLLEKSEIMALEMLELAMLSDDSLFKEFHIFAQVHLLQLFQLDREVLEENFDANNVDKNLRKELLKKFDEYWVGEKGKKSVDLVVCVKKSSEVLFAVEIDGSSHSEEKQMKSDEIKNFIFNSSGVPLLRFSNEEIKSMYKVMSKEKKIKKIVDRYFDAVKTIEEFHK